MERRLGHGRVGAARFLFRLRRNFRRAFVVSEIIQIKSVSNARRGAHSLRATRIRPAWCGGALLSRPGQHPRIAKEERSKNKKLNVTQSCFPLGRRNYAIMIIIIMRGVYACDKMFGFFYIF